MPDEKQIPLTEMLRSLSPEEFANLKRLEGREIKKALLKYQRVFDCSESVCYVDSSMYYR